MTELGRSLTRTVVGGVIGTALGVVFGYVLFSWWQPSDIVTVLVSAVIGLVFSFAGIRAAHPEWWGDD